MPDRPCESGFLLRQASGGGFLPAKRPLTWLVVGLATFGITVLVLAALGPDVPRAIATIATTSFRTRNGFVQTLLKLVPVSLMAFAFTIPLGAGKYNIGGEGQLLAGAIGATAVGLFAASLPRPLLVPFVLLVGVVMGSLWGFVPGWLLHRFGVHEILTTVLMNFVALHLVNYVAADLWPDPFAGHPTTIPIAREAFLPLLLVRPPLHCGPVIAILVGVAVWIYCCHTVAGFELAACGANPRASKVFGIDVRRASLSSLMIGGGLAGLAGALEVAGVHHRLLEGMQSNFQTLGILTGLIAGGDPRRVLPVAFFLSVLEVGAGALQRTMRAPIEVVFLVEAFVLVAVLVSDRAGRWRS